MREARSSVIDLGKSDDVGGVIECLSIEQDQVGTVVVPWLDVLEFMGKGGM